MFGKAGRADTPTDPAPFSMVETTVVLKAESEWRPVRRWYSRLIRSRCAGSSRAVVPEHITFEELQNEMDEALRFPGIPNVWTMPIRNRIDMLSTGMRTPDRHQGLRAGPDRDPAPRRAARGHPARRARHAQRLRRAHGRRLLPRLRPATARRWRATASRSTTRRPSSRRPSAARTSPRPSKAASATR